MAYRIGELAAAACVNVQTVRFYERTGLVMPARRSAAGYRQYEREALDRLRFIKQAQRLGFSLKEIDELLKLRIRQGAACEAIERRTLAKIDAIDARLRQLEQLKASLNRLVQSCRTRTRTRACPVLDALEEQHVAEPE